MPVMYVVAGPSGSGKTSLFSASVRKMDYFIGDDIAAVLNNKAGFQIDPNFFVSHNYHELPQEVRNAAVYTDIPDIMSLEIKKIGDAFINAHITNQKSFAIESTLTNDSMINLAKRAASQGFETKMDYVGVASNDISMERITNRSTMGRIYFTENECQIIREESFYHLPKAIEVFNTVNIFDNSINAHAPELVMQTELGKNIKICAPETPHWLQLALYNTKYDIASLTLQNPQIIDREKRIDEIKKTTAVKNPNMPMGSKTLYDVYAKEALTKTNGEWDKNITDREIAKSMLTDGIRPLRVVEVMFHSPDVIGMSREKVVQRSQAIIKSFGPEIAPKHTGLSMDL
jgi:predicted ABC-type ATPase